MTLRLTASPGKHPLGLDWGPGQCGDCAWSRLAGPGPRVLRCLASGNQRVQADWRGCIHHEAPLDCLACAACCGPAYHAVEVGPRDPVRKKQPQAVICKDGRFQIPRTDTNHCAMLREDNRCRIYGDRPRCCEGFERHGVNCLDARRRTGLSPRWSGR